MPAALSSRLRISVKYALILAPTKCASIGVNSFADATHASCSAEVERNQSNHVAHFARFRASSGLTPGFTDGFAFAPPPSAQTFEIETAQMQLPLPPKWRTAVLNAVRSERNLE